MLLGDGVVLGVGEALGAGAGLGVVSTAGVGDGSVCFESVGPSDLQTK
jgi:hypothetical protein